MPSLTRQQIRDVDRIAVEQFGVPGLILMENAGRGAAEILLDRGIDGRVAICCGKGNNAGDGYTLARHLLIAGIETEILAFAAPDSLRGDAASQCEIARRLGVPIREIPDSATDEEMTEALLGSDWIVDALLGTGITGPPRPPFDRVIRAVNTAATGGTRVLALDLPSGLDADAGTSFRDENGRSAPCIRADLTTTFAARKIGFDEPRSREYTGDVFVVGIGVPNSVIDSAKAL